MIKDENKTGVDMWIQYDKRDEEYFLDELHSFLEGFQSTNIVGSWTSEPSKLKDIKHHTEEIFHE